MSLLIAISAESNPCVNMELLYPSQPTTGAPHTQSSELQLDFLSCL